uniref:acid phosphatase n=1 Tax=Ornithorhynchus anatinus TaxID=9258 RepID=A0A6I8NE87_ORNAN
RRAESRGWALPQNLLPLHRTPDPPTSPLLPLSPVYRHGDRAPPGSHPRDHHADAVWPRGLQQLTRHGLRQHPLPGHPLPAGPRSDPHRLVHPQLYVRGTDYDRTLLSAQANLAGLYPPRPAKRWSPDGDWQPVPIHTVPPSQDKVSTRMAGRGWGRRGADDRPVARAGPQDTIATGEPGCRLGAEVERLRRRRPAAQK